MVSRKRKAEREAEWVRQSVRAGVDYLVADDNDAVERVLRRADAYEIQWGVVQIARRAVAALAEIGGTTPAEVTSRLGDEVIASKQQPVETDG